MKKRKPGLLNNSGQILMETLFVAAFMSVLLLVFGKMAEMQRERRMHRPYVNTTEFQNAKK